MPKFTKPLSKSHQLTATKKRNKATNHQLNSDFSDEEISSDLKTKSVQLEEKKKEKEKRKEKGKVKEKKKEKEVDVTFTSEERKSKKIKPEKKKLKRKEGETSNKTDVNESNLRSEPDVKSEFEVKREKIKEREEEVEGRKKEVEGKEKELEGKEKEVEVEGKEKEVEGNEKEVEGKEKEETSDENVTFKSLGVCEELCIACESLNWKNPTPIQIQCIPHSIKKRDIIGLAETGSGKTAAFAIPILHCLLDEASHRGVYALILSPTRELSAQITETFYGLGSSIDLKICTILGGLDMMVQALELAKKPHIIVATPGRIVDHLENTKGFHLGTIKFFVMDEADRLLSMDFEDALQKLLSLVPKTRTTMLFSATMTERVSKLQKASLVNPVKVSVNSKFDTVKNLIQHMKLVAPQFKMTYLVAVLTYYKTYKTIVFVNTCLDTQKVANTLHQLGFMSVCLHGKMTQPQRLGALNSFKSGSKRILVATEVGSRGLDIPHVELVLNYDVPLGSKDYVHRVGRTARAGRSGRSIIFVTQYDIQTFQQIEFDIKKRMDPFTEIPDDYWRPLYTKVEEARLLIEHEMKDQNSLNKNNKQFKKKKKYSGKKI